MNKFCLLMSLVFLLTSADSFAAQHSYGLGFVIPQINDKAHVSNPVAGEVVLDTSDNIFYGRDSGSNWVGLNAPVGAYVPAGTVIAYAGGSAPTGYLPCDGSAVSRTTYAVLFGVIGTTYGSGDGSTTFNLPDTRGIFVRGSGTQTISGVTYSATAGSKQTDQMQGHVHNQVAANGSGGGGPQISAGSFFSNGNFYSTAYGTDGVPSSDGSNGTPRTGSETRPANLSMMYIIKN